MARHTLILLRHAKSDWSGDHADVDRPLAARGKRQAPEAGRWLAAHLPDIDLAVVSPANRAASTWRLAAAELEDPPPTTVDDRMYSFAVGPLLVVARSLPEDVGTAVLVGHNPAMAELVEALTGEWSPMPTSALAVLDLDGPWQRAGRDRARLRAWGRPPAAHDPDPESGTQSR